MIFYIHLFIKCNTDRFLGKVWFVSDTDFVLLPEFYKPWCTTYISDGFEAHATRPKDFSALSCKYF